MRDVNGYPVGDQIKNKLTIPDVLGYFVSHWVSHCVHSLSAVKLDVDFHYGPPLGMVLIFILSLTRVVNKRLFLIATGNSV